MSSSLAITHTRQFRAECGAAFYLACLELAQSLWLQQRPAQAILQLNKSMMAVLPANHQVLAENPIPYRALLWIIGNASDEKFIGNPPRHFQHLATRMNHKLPQPELRIARAWCCLHLSETLLPSDKFPRDQLQIETEKLSIPTKCQAIEMLRRLTPHSHEGDELSNLLTMS